MLFLNDILHQPVYDSQGEKIGTLADLVISTHESFPVVTGVVVALAKKRSHLRPPARAANRGRLLAATPSSSPGRTWTASPRSA